MISGLQFLSLNLQKKFYNKISAVNFLQNRLQNFYCFFVNDIVNSKVQLQAVEYVMQGEKGVVVQNMISKGTIGCDIVFF